MKFSEGNISNPMLVGAIELMKAEPTDEHKKLFVSEMMKAVFLRPALVTPRPEIDENGQIRPAKGSRVQFPMLTAPDGKNFFMLFTDKTEYNQWSGRENPDMVVMQGTMEEACVMTLRGDGGASGAVINPYGGNIVIGKEMMAQLAAARLAQNAKQGEAGKAD